MKQERHKNVEARSLSRVAPVLIAGAVAAGLVGPVFAGVTISAGGNVSLASGSTQNMGCTNVDVQGTLLLNAAQVNAATNITVGAAGVLNGGSGTIELNGNWTNAGSFIPGTGTVLFNQVCNGTGPYTIGNTTFHNLTLTGGPFIVTGCPGLRVTGVLTVGQGVTLQAPPGQSACITVPPGNIVGNPNLNRVTLAGNTPPNAVPILGEFGLLLLVLLMSAFGAKHAGSSGQPLNSRIRKVLVNFSKGSGHE